MMIMFHLNGIRSLSDELACQHTENAGSPRPFCLAPEELLFIARVSRGHNPIHERQLRPLTAMADWRKQRQMWKYSERGGCRCNSLYNKDLGILFAICLVRSVEIAKIGGLLG